MTSPTDRRALYYPFHICHVRTLARLLEEYASVHFRDYMALQLTPLTGTTAYPDRMGDGHPDLVLSGRIVQGYRVSGPLDQTMAALVNRDLADEKWRALYHQALQEDRRFQRGLFDLSHGMLIADSLVPGPAAFLRLTESARRSKPYRLEDVQSGSGVRLADEAAYDREYALGLVKTSASLGYTVRLCSEHGLEAVTDSDPHARLLERTCAREGVTLVNRALPRQGE